MAAHAAAARVLDVLRRLPTAGLARVESAAGVLRTLCEASKVAPPATTTAASALLSVTPRTTSGPCIIIRTKGKGARSMPPPRLDDLRPPYTAPAPKLPTCVLSDWRRGCARTQATLSDLTTFFTVTAGTNTTDGAHSLQIAAAPVSKALTCAVRAWDAAAAWPAPPREALWASADAAVRVMDTACAMLQICTRTDDAALMSAGVEAGLALGGPLLQLVERCSSAAPAVRRAASRARSHMQQFTVQCQIMYLSLHASPLSSNPAIALTAAPAAASAAASPSSAPPTGALVPYSALHLFGPDSHMHPTLEVLQSKHRTLAHLIARARGANNTASSAPAATAASGASPSGARTPSGKKRKALALKDRYWAARRCCRRLLAMTPPRASERKDRFSLH